MDQTSEEFLVNQGTFEAGKLAELGAIFLQNVEHELRTPVAIIQGYADLLSEGSLGVLDPEQQKAIFAITHRAHELRVLIERVTTLLAVKAQAISFSLFNLAEIVAAVTEKRRFKVIEAGVTLNVNLASELPLGIGHPYHLQQAVDCLLDNALKFTPSGGWVEIRVDADPEWLYLTVTDTGIGIAEERLAHIFDLFYQLDGSTTRRYNGLGLGLAVVKAVVEAYSGQIEIRSHPDRGSQFSLKFPALPLEANREQPVEKNTLSHRILIVDDEETMILTFQDGLEKIPNCEIVTANSGEQALALFNQRPFNLLITDYKMPAMDGLSLAAQVRQNYPHTVIIMVTGFSSDEFFEQANKISIQRILNKPVELNEFRQTATEMLEKVSQSQQDFLQTQEVRCSKNDPETTL